MTDPQAHIVDFLKAKFGLVIGQSYITYFAYAGDYDYDSPRGSSDGSAFAAAMDYAACYDEAMFDAMDRMQNPGAWL